jgi:hypothetical protein
VLKKESLVRSIEILRQALKEYPGAKWLLAKTFR